LSHEAFSGNLLLSIPNHRKNSAVTRREARRPGMADTGGNTGSGIPGRVVFAITLLRNAGPKGDMRL
jgi:hypothetical protein